MTNEQQRSPILCLDKLKKHLYNTIWGIKSLLMRSLVLTKAQRQCHHLQQCLPMTAQFCCLIRTKMNRGRTKRNRGVTLITQVVHWDMLSNLNYSIILVYAFTSMGPFLCKTQRCFANNERLFANCNNSVKSVTSVKTVSMSNQLPSFPIGAPWPTLTQLLFIWSSMKLLRQQHALKILSQVRMLQ